MSSIYTNVGSIIMVPAYYDTEAEQVSLDRSGVVCFNNSALASDVGKGYEFYVKARKTEKGTVAFSGRLFQPKVHKDDKPFSPYYINFVQNTKEDSSAVLLVFVKSIPEESSDEESEVLYMGSMFRGAVAGVTRGTLSLPKTSYKRAEAPPLEKAGSIYTTLGNLTF